MNGQSFKIDGFHCESCVKLATMKIKKINGVRDVRITVDGSTEVDADRAIMLGEVSNALDGLGYSVKNA